MSLTLEKWAREIEASSLTKTLKEGLKSGNFVGDPKAGSYTVAPEGIVVETTVSVVLPPSKVFAAASPKQTLKMVSQRPELLLEVPDAALAALPFQALKGPQFSAFVKKMGGLGQYSEEVLRALLEGRSKTGWEAADEIEDALWPLVQKDIRQYVSGPFHWNDWGHPTSANLKVKGGALTGTFTVPVEFELERGLAIKKDVDGSPYVDLDPNIHGTGEKSTHPSLKGVPADRLEKDTSMQGYMATRLDDRLPKGTPGVVRVDVDRPWRIEKTPLTAFSRADLQDLVYWMAA